MKIAIATEGTHVPENFEGCENFTILEIENTEVINKSVINTVGNPYGLPILLLTHGALTVIANEMDECSIKELRSNGIEYITGASGTIEKTIQDYLNGSLKISYSHGHDHDHEH